ncbi:MAG: 50S ribosomal protein L25/general stress protein Ctc [Aquisalinus sp.]|nr:50S ribosomal protein L25/general stress protein Ctc [Aquisalinus sp.]
MSDVTVFTCELRQRSGTGGSRAVRRDGWVPAILYGGDQEPANIKLRYNEVLKAYNTGKLISVLSKINVDGQEQSVIGRDIQVDPVKDLPLHVDLMRVSEKTRINVDVPMSFLNEEASPGLKRGGVLNVVRHTVEVIAPATRIPEALEADLTGLDIGDAVHISSVNLPEGVEPTITDRDFTIATIAAPSVVRSADNEGDAEDDAAEDSGDEGETGDNE